MYFSKETWMNLLLSLILGIKRSIQKFEPLVLERLNTILIEKREKSALIPKYWRNSRLLQDESFVFGFLQSSARPSGKTIFVEYLWNQRTWKRLQSTLNSSSYFSRPGNEQEYLHLSLPFFPFWLFETQHGVEFQITNSLRWINK